MLVLDVVVIMSRAESDPAAGPARCQHPGHVAELDVVDIDVLTGVGHARVYVRRREDRQIARVMKLELWSQQPRLVGVGDDEHEVDVLASSG